MLKIENNYDEDLNFTVYDVVGKIVKQGIIKSNTYELLNMENMTMGYYCIKTQSLRTGFILDIYKLLKTNQE